MTVSASCGAALTQPNESASGRNCYPCGSRIEGTVEEMPGAAYAINDLTTQSLTRTVWA
jgi:hypothetical protein